MFNNKLLKAEIQSLKRVIEDQEERISKLENEVFNEDYLEWKTQHNANEELAAKQGYWYLNSKADVTLLEQVIQKINENEDLTALFKTADGATLSLRVHSQPSQDRKSTNFNRFSEEE